MVGYGERMVLIFQAGLLRERRERLLGKQTVFMLSDGSFSPEELVYISHQDDAWSKHIFYFSFSKQSYSRAMSCGYLNGAEIAVL